MDEQQIAQQLKDEFLEKSRNFDGQQLNTLGNFTGMHPNRWETVNIRIKRKWLGEIVEDWSSQNPSQLEKLVKKTRELAGNQHLTNGGHMNQKTLSRDEKYDYIRRVIKGFSLDQLEELCKMVGQPVDLSKVQSFLIKPKLDAEVRTLAARCYGAGEKPELLNSLYAEVCRIQGEEPRPDQAA